MKGNNLHSWSSDLTKYIFLITMQLLHNDIIITKMKSMPTLGTLHTFLKVLPHLKASRCPSWLAHVGLCLLTLPPLRLAKCVLNNHAITTDKKWRAWPHYRHITHIHKSPAKLPDALLDWHMWDSVYKLYVRSVQQNVCQIYEPKVATNEIALAIYDRESWEYKCKYNIPCVYMRLVGDTVHLCYCEAITLYSHCTIYRRRESVERERWYPTYIHFSSY